MFARVSLSQAARLCSQPSRNFASSAARAVPHTHASRFHDHPLFKNVSPQFFTANKFQPSYVNNLWEARQQALKTHYQLRAFHADRKQGPPHRLFTSSSPFFRSFNANASARAAGGATASSATKTASATRGFCGGRKHGTEGAGPWQEAMDQHWNKWHKHHMRWYQRHAYHHHHHRPRRPFRSLFKAIVYSTAIAAIPLMLVFGTSTVLPILFVPIAVGGALFFAGGMVFFILPVVLIGGAVTFFAFSMPAAVAFKDVNKILKRDKDGTDGWSALGTLGKDWEIQPAGKDEYFHWSFPTKRQPLDKVELRVAVFDPEDNSRRKHKTLKWIDRLVDGINEDNEPGSHRRHRRRGSSDDIYEKDDDDSDKKTTTTTRRNKFEYRNSRWDDCEGPKDLTLRRDGNHVEIQFEDDGQKIMNTKIAKKYLRLGQIVDRAASEIEAREGRKLGDQVVLVRKADTRDSCWSSWTPYGDIALRIPFSRQWVHDLSDE
ncbi:hypothetical protein BGZ73_006919 [Actinomortierella ambigua]|nr:hypothetical protein BGZ73_006919 [Actinomortierella ambigua]